MAPTIKIGDNFEFERPEGFACLERGILYDFLTFYN